jgi:hypothetical protein
MEATDADATAIGVATAITAARPTLEAMSLKPFFQLIVTPIRIEAAARTPGRERLTKSR